jgi:hypothetical protein
MSSGNARVPGRLPLPSNSTFRIPAFWSCLSSAIAVCLVGMPERAVKSVVLKIARSKIASSPSVAVLEGMDKFKLRMNNGGLNQHIGIIAAKIALPGSNNSVSATHFTFHFLPILPILMILSDV